jgi:hypothetical protein
MRFPIFIKKLFITLIVLFLPSFLVSLFINIRYYVELFWSRTQ